MSLDTSSTSASINLAPLTSALPTQLHLPGSSEYESFVGSYFFAQPRLRPAAVITCTNSSSVSAAVRALSKLCIPFAVRGGGHSPNPSHAGIDRAGVALDLRDLSAAAYDPDAGVLRVGGGATWAQVYPVADALGVHVLGGRAAGVGVGGLLSGGGCGFLTGTYGWACDSVVGCEVVLGSGKVVEASAVQNADLLRAVKGGQNNFGVVTRWDLKTIAGFPRFYGGAIVNPEAAAGKCIAEFVRTCDPADEEYDSKISTELSFGYISAANTFVASNQVFYASAGDDAPEKVRRFTDIQPQFQSSMRFARAAEFAKEVQDVQPATARRAAYASTTFKMTEEMLQEVVLLWRRVSEELSALDPQGVYAISLQPVPRHVTAGQPENVMGLPTDLKMYVIALVNLYWADEALDENGEGAALKLVEEIEEQAGKLGLSFDYKYLNYANRKQDVIEGYGQEQVAFLRETAKKYDPGHVFQKLCRGGFKLY